jgi:putative ABC transport system substrate-binding protein
MRRRDFIAGLTLAMVARGAEARQPTKARRIAFFSTASPPSATADAFVQRLAELGYVEGRNLLIEWRWGRGSTERYPEFAAQVVALNVDAIVASSSSAALAAQRATKTIPIVVAAAEDAVREGFAASLAQPGGNVTGLTLQSPELQGKRLQMFKEALPQISRVAILSDVSGRQEKRRIEVEFADAAARKLGIQLEPVVEISDAGDIAAAFTAINRAGADAVLMIGGTMFFANRIKVAAAARERSLPMMCGLREHAEAGYLFSYGANLIDSFRRAAALVAKILEGVAPAALPFEQPTKFDFVVNLKTSRTLGLTIPPSILARADEVIE